MRLASLKDTGKHVLSRTVGGFGHIDNRTVVLLYHSISSNSHSTEPRRFAQHLRWISENTTVVRLDQVLARATIGNAGRPSLAITFDDGFLDNYTEALPALMDHGFPATFFITTGFIDQEPDVVERFRRLRGTNDLSAMTWPQLSELVNAGMQIGAHARTHPNLAVTNDQSALLEIVESKDRLEERLGVPVTSFAYPFGKPKHHVTARIREAVRTAGFHRAATVCFRGIRPNDSPYAIPRFSIGNDSADELRDKVLGRFDFIGGWQEHAPRWLSNLVSPANTHSTESSSPL